jgi:hypothetical protein
MDLEETKARNDCAGKGQQQFNWTTNWAPANSNTYIVALQVAGDDKKGTQCLGI